jgi:hypothetical protein
VKTAKGLERVFPGKSLARWCLRPDFGRTSPPGLSSAAGGRRLSGAGPQVLQQPGQEIAVRIARGQVHPDAAAGFPDAGPDLQEFEPQRVHLSRGQFRALKVPAQQPKEASRRRCAAGAGTGWPGSGGSSDGRP